MAMNPKAPNSSLYEAMKEAQGKEDAKKSKASVNYRDSENPKRCCGNCSMFDAVAHCCSAVKGTIHKDDVCDMWEKRKKGA